jgi:hypothetical protein
VTQVSESRARPVATPPTFADLLLVTLARNAEESAPVAGGRRVSKASIRSTGRASPNEDRRLAPVTGGMTEDERRAYKARNGGRRLAR